MMLSTVFNVLMVAICEGGGAFPQVTSLLRLLRLYITETRSCEPAKSLILLMDGALNGLEISFIIHEKMNIRHWSKSLLETFTNLLKLYSAVLRKAGHTPAAKNMVVRLMKGDVFPHLLREYAQWLIGPNDRKDVTQKETIAWQITMWFFLKCLAEAVKSQVLRKIPMQEVTQEDTVEISGMQKPQEFACFHLLNDIHSLKSQ